jgi:hypothetical protein
MDATPISYTIKKAVLDTGYSRSRIYELIADGKLDVRKDGRKTVIMAQSLRDYIASLPGFVSQARAA